MTAEKAIADFLASLGLKTNPEVNGTPERVATMWRDNLLIGENKDPKMVLQSRMRAPSKATVVLTGLPFHSVCPHHLVPFYGQVHLAYTPGDYIVGLGHLEALVTACSRRLILQEELCTLITETLESELEAEGAACAVDAYHLCLSLRGNTPRDARVYTYFATGSLNDSARILPGPSVSGALRHSYHCKGEHDGHH